MSIKETCNKCGKEVIESKKLDSNVWNCPNCGLEEYRPVNNSTEEVNKESNKPKYYLNEEQTVFLSLSEDTAVVEGNGKIEKQLWNNLKKELNLKNYKIEIKEGIQLPDNCTKMFANFEKEINIDPNIDTSNVTNMSYMFEDATTANPDVSSWDVSKVKNMSCMFRLAEQANPDTSNWDTSEVREMSYMFSGAISANPDVSNWNTSKVWDMSYMFYEATSADPDVSKWNVSKVAYMSHMFEEAVSANPNTSRWDTSSVRNMRRMFFGATSANPDTSNWDTSSIDDMSSMFRQSAYTGRIL